MVSWEDDATDDDYDNNENNDNDADDGKLNSFMPLNSYVAVRCIHCTTSWSKFNLISLCSLLSFCIISERFQESIPTTWFVAQPASQPANQPVSLPASQPAHTLKQFQNIIISYKYDYVSSFQG